MTKPCANLSQGSQLKWNDLNFTLRMPVVVFYVCSLFIIDIICLLLSNSLLFTESITPLRA